MKNSLILVRTLLTASSSIKASTQDFIPSIKATITFAILSYILINIVCSSIQSLNLMIYSAIASPTFKRFVPNKLRTAARIFNPPTTDMLIILLPSWNIANIPSHIFPKLLASSSAIVNSSDNRCKPSIKPYNT